jgi:hypothetical protein
MILVYRYPVTSWATLFNKPARAVSVVGHPLRAILVVATKTWPPWRRVGMAHGVG